MVGMAASVDEHPDSELNPVANAMMARSEDMDDDMVLPNGGVSVRRRGRRLAVPARQIAPAPTDDDLAPSPMPPCRSGYTDPG